MTEFSFRHPAWHRRGTVHVRGHAVAPNGDSVDLAEEYGSVSSFEEFCRVTRSLHGFFAAVVHGPDEIFLAVDRIRSVPLYFSMNIPLAVGDAVAGIYEGQPRTEFDPIAESEFLLTRYVTGGETLLPGVKSVRAGEAVRIPMASPQDFERRRYWTYRPTDDVTGSESSASRQLLSSLEAAVDRTASVVGDRPVVVPLSGGLDSRLVASELVDAGLSVTAYTFGRRGHADVEVSRRVADNLGIDWEWVEYTPERWAEWYHSRAYKRYCDWAFNYDSLPFLANWPAVKELSETDRIPSDAVVCPGHTVATPSERVPEAWLETSPERDTVLDQILAQYDLWEWSGQDARTAFEARIASETDLEGLGTAGSAAAAYESWEWSTRMATFTHGDLRIYDWFDFDWWLPLWDRAYVDAWAGTPFEFRQGKALQNSIARDRYAATADVDRSAAGLTDRDWTPLDALRQTVRSAPRSFLAENFDAWFGAAGVPRSGWETPGQHPLGWYGILPEKALELLRNAKNLYAIRTLIATQRLSLDPLEVPDDVLHGRIELPLSDGQI